MVSLGLLQCSERSYNVFGLTAEELRVCEQFHKMCSVSWLNVVTLQVKRDIAEGTRVPIDIESPHTARIVCRMAAGR